MFLFYQTNTLINVKGFIGKWSILKHSSNLQKLAFFCPSVMLFGKSGFTPCKTEELVRGMELQEKEEEKD